MAARAVRPTAPRPESNGPCETLVSRNAELYELFDSDPASMLGFLGWIAESNAIAAPRVLDVGCGPGRLLAHFDRLGWSAVGLEPDPEFFARAVERAAAWPDIVVRQGGFAEIPTEGNFDLLIAMNGPFSYVLTPAQREQACQRAFGALRPGGLVIIDMANFPWVLKNYRALSEDRRTFDGGIVRRFPLHSFDFHNCVWTHRDVFVVQAGRSSTKIEQSHRMSMIGFPEVARVLQLSGFEAICTYNGYHSRKREELTGSRLLVSARKPGR